MSVSSLATTRINVYRVTTVQDIYGSYKESYQVVYSNIPARVNYKVGRETLSNGKIQNTPTYRIYLPTQLTIYNSDVIVDIKRDLYYDILYINKMDRAHHLQIDTKLSNSLISPSGWVWGYNGAALSLLEESWITWMDDGTSTVATNTGDWGQLRITGLDKFVSPVKDTGDSNSKTITLEYDTYDTGSSNGNKYIWWRGDYSPFKQDNIVIPWTVYTTAFVTTKRYFQVKVAIY